MLCGVYAYAVFDEMARNLILLFDDHEPYNHVTHHEILDEFDNLGKQMASDVNN